MWGVAKSHLQARKTQNWESEQSLEKQKNTADPMDAFVLSILGK